MKKLSNLNRYFDHTILKADAVKSEIETLCREAVENEFYSVCVNPSWIPFCVKKTAKSNVLVCTVVGFPLGAMSTKSKVYETKQAIDKGASEVDMVINVGKLKDKDFKYLEKEFKDMRKASDGVVLKVIIETALLTDTEKETITKMIGDTGCDFVKTSTGFSKSGATVEDIQLFMKVKKPELKIKASGGIKTLDQTLALIEAGANRIGASSSVSILKEWKEKCSSEV